jgi:ABC-type multidrug transport system fused ATPase/permease subunit
MTPAQKRSAVGLVALMLVSTLFEMLGIGLILPGLTVLSGTKPSREPGWTSTILAALGNPTRMQVVVWGAVGLLGIYLSKAAVVLLTAYRGARFVRQLDRSICERLFRMYLTQPWACHLRRNSADMIRNITSVAGIADACASTLNALAETLILAGVGAVLLWLDPVATLVVGMLAAASTWLLDRVFKQRSRRWGELRHDYHGRLTKTVHQGLGGVKDAKMRGCENHFFEQFSRHAAMVAAVSERQSFVFVVPRLWHELVGVAALCLLTLILMWQGKPLESFIPTLGVFAAAGFRMLPSVNRLSTALQLMNYWGPTVDTVVGELGQEHLALPTGDAEPVPFRDRIVLDGVGFAYEGAAIAALEAVNLSIPHGSAVGIVGASGAGKSTLVDVILGLLPPSKGRVLIDGVDLTGRERGWQRSVGYVPQSIYLCDDTIRANVAFGIDEASIDDAAVSRAIRAAQLDDFVTSLPEGLNTFVGERGVRLSGGQRQRIGIARALYHDPQLLVLDEATSALDTETERGVMGAVEALHGAKTLVIVAHRLSTVENCDVLYRLEKGRIVRSGSFHEVAHS